MNLILFLTLILTGCASQLRYDRVEYALPSGYDSVEIKGCNSYSYGSSICEVKKNSFIETFEIQSLYKGKIVVDGCGVSQSQEYSNSELIKISPSNVVTQDCVMSVTLSPDLPNQDKSAVIVGSLRGHIYLFVKDPSIISHHRFNQVSLGGGSPVLKLFLGGETEANVILVGSGVGCKVALSKKYDAVEGFIEVPLSDFSPAVKPGTCVFRGRLVTPSESSNIYWVINYYKNTFIPLSIPAIEWKKEKLCITSDENVSIVDVDGKHTVASSGCFDIDKNKDFIVRSLTVGGRSAVGMWNSKLQDFTWYN